MQNSFINLQLLDSYKPSAISQTILSSSTLLVGVQHLLETTGSLIEKLISFGLQPSNIYLSGKSYSTNTSVYTKLLNKGLHLTPDSCDSSNDFSTKICSQINIMWASVVKRLSQDPTIKNIIILDDGGRCLELMPSKLDSNLTIKVVEQTSSGIERIKKLNTNINVISVASAKAKLNHESPLIAQKAVDILHEKGSLNFRENKNILVVGIGSIGSSVIECLQNYDNYHLMKIDLKDYKLHSSYIESLNKLVDLADIVIGCTGRDISKDFMLNKLCGKKVFVSLSSEDIEFYSVIQAYSNLWVKDPNKSRDLYFQTSKLKLKLLNQGYPLNFENKKHSIDPELISLTRSLLLAGIFQAAESISRREPNSGMFIPLDTLVQSELTNRWKNTVKVN